MANDTEVADLTAILTGLQVWVVDDNMDCAHSTAALLAMFGATTRPLLSGAEFLEAAAASPPDLALIDIGMPGMDGFQVARLVRAAPAPLSSITMGALSGWGDRENVQRMAEAGFDFQLLKPMEYGDLLEKMASLPPGKKAAAP